MKSSQRLILRFVFTPAIFFVVCLSHLYSQKPFRLKDNDAERMEAINSWFYAVKDEYRFSVGDSVQRWLRRNQGQIQRIYGRSGFVYSNESPWVHLYSDENFVPAFGEPVDKITDATAAKITESLLRCTKSKDLSAEQVAIARVVYGEFYSSRYKYFIPKVQKLREARKTYQELLKKMANPATALTNDEIDNYHILDFELLLPVEFNLVTTVFDNARVFANDNTARRQLETVLNMKPDPKAVYQNLWFFEIHGYIGPSGSVLSSKMSDELYTEIHSKLDQRLPYVLAELLNEEQNKINALPAGDAGIDSINNMYRSFKKNYVFKMRQSEDYLASNPSVKKMKQLYSDALEKNLQARRTELEKKINEAQGTAQLGRIYDTYFKILPDNDLPVTRALKEKVTQRMAVIDLKADDTIDALIAKQKQDYLKKLTEKGPLLKFNGLKNENFRHAYMREFSLYDDGTPGNPSGEPRIMQKMLMAAYSDTCRTSLPLNSKKMDVKVLKTSGYSNTRIYDNKGLKGGHSTPYFDWVIIGTFYTFPEFYETLENYPVLNGGGEPIDLWMYVLDGSMLAQYPSVWQDKGLETYREATRLIANNGCKHPGLYTIIENLHYEITRYHKPERKKVEEFTAEKGYTFNNAESYYELEKPADYTRKEIKNVLERHYTNAPHNFVPPTILPTDINKWKVVMNVYHSNDQSSGITSAEITTVGPLNLGFDLQYINGKPVDYYYSRKLDKKIPIPDDIMAEYKANVSSYYIIDMFYNYRNTGNLERARAIHWLAKGKVPSQKFQDFFKENISAPIESIAVIANTIK